MKSPAQILFFDSRKHPRDIHHFFRFAFIAFLAVGWTVASARAQITCNGQTDTTAAINAAVAALQPGQTLTLPPGVCVISSPITGFNPNASASAPITLQGSGNHQTVLQATSTNAPNFPFSPIEVVNSFTVNENSVTIIPANYVTITNLTIDGGVTLGTSGPQPGCNTQGDSADGVLVMTGSYDNVSNNTIQNLIGGVTLMGTAYNTVSSNTINGVQANGIYAIGRNSCLVPQGVVATSTNNSILYNTVENVSQYRAAGYGQTHPNSGLVGWDGIDTNETSYDTISGNVVQGDDIIVNCRTTSYCYGNTITYNNVTNSLNVGIDLSGSQQNFTINGNTINTTAWGGIDINGAMTAAAGTNNEVTNNSLNMVDNGDTADGYPGYTDPNTGITYPGVPYVQATEKWCSGINVRNTTLYYKGTFPMNVVVSNNTVNTTYTTLTQPFPYWAACVYGKENSSVQIVDNNFPNRTGDGNAEIYVDPKASPTVSGNTDGGQ